MLTNHWKKLLLTVSTFLPAICIAAMPSWKIQPADSNLSFTATQNGAPVTGQFKSFTGDINFDPNQLNASNVKIVVDLASVTDAYNELSDTLKAADWFDIKVFPQATFESHQFVKTGDKSYQSKGTLTIRDKTQPVTLAFTFSEYTPTKATLSGSTTIKRTAFGVGQGEWKDTTAVKDDVQVNFKIVAVSKP